VNAFGIGQKETPNFQASRLPRVSSGYRDVGHTSVGPKLGGLRETPCCSAVPEGDLDEIGLGAARNTNR
jgi:hypothetical protein